MTTDKIVEYRHAGAKHLKELLEKNSKELPRDQRFLLTREEINRIRSELDKLKRGDSSKFIVAVHKDDGVIGFCNFDVSRWSPKEATIESIEVVPKHRQNSVGSSLLEEVERAVARDNIETLHVVTLEKNAEWYRKRGFEPTYTSKSFRKMQKRVDR
ncbi:MAG: GNAT family N-acetyltransferase [Candidatus Diapherotrites archaeon]|nr:GNAT family N-acetyltransferase [Candidatus Diapherotrites archaeon]